MTPPITHQEMRYLLLDAAKVPSAEQSESYIAQAELVEKERDKWRAAELRSSGELAAVEGRLLKLDELSSEGVVMIDAWGPMGHEGRMAKFDLIADRISEIKRERDELKAKLHNAAAHLSGRMLDKPPLLIALDEYERANLRMALECIMTLRKFAPLNTGDWVGEIRWLLSPPHARPEDVGEPNRSVEDTQQATLAFEDNARLAAVVREHESIIRTALGWLEHDSVTLENEAKAAHEALAEALK